MASMKEIFDKWFEAKDSSEALITDLVCLSGKNPDPEKLRTYCQPTKCKHLATRDVILAKGAGDRI